MTDKPTPGADGAPLGRDAFRREYLARIHRAQDYIEKHLDEPLVLEHVALAASFSPFHFHRLYSAITGETVFQFIQRVRLERAASSLASRPREPITAIALDHGFSSPATFARAFRAYFGVSASQYRQAWMRKISKANGKEGKDPTDGPDYPPVVDIDTIDRRIAMTQEDPRVQAQSIEVRDLPEKSLAYVRHVGPYAGDMALFGRLWDTLARWATPRDLFRPPHTEVITVYHDDPAVTDADKLRISYGITVPTSTPVDGEIGLMVLPAGKYVCARFEIDASQYGAAWAFVCGDWLSRSGWQPADGPCYESYLNDPSTHPDGKHIVEIRLSVRPLMA